ncbi:Fe-S protein [Candidatus Kinetoplastibacterium blastocrithidii TCC012E]|uniref:Fe-S protein n=1 Tax=Candidatus Kinetoplastidibacterium blastocrithidiae TCC012E TaxID=1208922 RepID=M1MEE4_9PROT|nr:DUF1289 domain-containing protein [Candidatus Kinetoplastibacterium blastocrithidii]AFZ83284.1 hypothetical protein CKBE_00095 [Candidatus Kinetoplastibacterium blastocrithidii (ex Strigomonas culicis)]AGF50100.1 Fe-S protein [Candidatus Kinetoplastibacterium blastocrithidii TCC012E]
MTLVSKSSDENSEDSILSITDVPCVGVCTTLFDDICRGCGRTLFEVSNWVFFSNEEKLDVWSRIRSNGYLRKNNI